MYKKQAEAALEASSIPFVIVRTSCSERPPGRYNQSLLSSLSCLTDTLVGRSAEPVLGCVGL